MPRTFTIKDAYLENRLFLNRIVVSFAVIIVLFSVLCSRLIYLQIVGHEHYSTLSRHNRVRISPLVPTRGLIFDRHGKILAENQSTYSLELIPEQVPDLQATLSGLQQLINIEQEEIDRFYKVKNRRKSFSGIPLLLQLNEDEVSRFSVRRPHFQGVDIHARLFRNYPFGALTSHVVGYVGRIDEAELKAMDPANYRGTQYIGKTGIENFYEQQLHGHTGYQEMETNAQGRSIRVLNETPPVPGVDLHLTLDIDLQKTAYDELGEFSGAVVALELPTGNVLVFVSKPGFDPNPFVFGISHKSYKALQSSPDQPMFNRALSGQYPPGSTVKPFVALAGLEYRVANHDQKLYCPGFYQLANASHRFRDWKKGGHGFVNMKSAIVQSCDVYFYDLAYNLGIDRIYNLLHQFGFGSETGIDIHGEKSGLLPSPEWKRRAKGQVWFPGETLITGIGQGFTQATPLQLAKATALIANPNKPIRPHLVNKISYLDGTKDVTQKSLKPLDVDPGNLNFIISSMTDVVHSARGTAKRISDGIDYRIAGKTGTAQVFTVKQEEKYEEKDVDKRLRDHALFIAFAPVDNPSIAISVIVENGGHGSSVAAPIARKIIDQYLSAKL